MRIWAFLVVSVAVASGCGDGSGKDTGQCAVACDDGNPCNGVEACVEGACTPGTALADGVSCGSDKVCRAGACVATRCGDGIVDADEECDDHNTIDGDGCDADCRYSCVSTDATRACAPSDVCAGQGVCNDATHVCGPGTALPEGTACATGTDDYCHAGVCTAPVCGNQVTEPGEDCDGGAGCTAACAFACSDNPAVQCMGETLPACQKFSCTATHTCETVADTAQDGMACDVANPDSVCAAGACVATSVCGNGAREAGEDCDDGNTVNLDGCDSACRLEQDARITSLQQQFTPDAFCPRNALGAAIAPEAQSTIQATWDGPVGDGSLSIVFKFLGLAGVLGPDTTAPFSLGFVNAAPVLFEGAPYDGTHDLDWWYVREPVSVDASEVPVVQLPGQLDRGHLTAGPGTISLKLLFALSPAQVTLFNAVVDARIDGAVGAPLVATGDQPPGHLAGEHVAPGLATFTTSSVGAMCSDVSAASLFATPMPDLLQTVCTRADGETPAFTPDNKLLDVFIAGCLVFGQTGFIPTQPDGALDGATYHFDFDPTTLAVATCTRNGAPEDLAVCVAQATYSSSFKFESDRVIIHRN